MELLLEGKLNEYLHDIDEECYEMLDLHGPAAGVDH